ncbi:NUDIX domain-containing protein [Streptomyces sp. NRRL S-87]|uniref:NUDIX domain-containing protein n=1 Tax=Streptomyces sp. NRRL S-87 TaxID=1463920 RepID=UPI000A57CC36|nr:NUDIX domain-containing protein [Streptomyces sp. NRRL S-87]
MTDRVRGVLVTPEGRLLFIRRTRPGVDPYLVFVGGGVEDTDPGPRAALLREIHEEIAGHGVRIHGLLHTEPTREGGRHDFYVCTVAGWDWDARSGAEFARTDRGTYELVEVPLVPEALDGVELLPPGAAGALRTAIASGSLAALTRRPWSTIAALADRFDAADEAQGMRAEESHVLQVLKIGEEFGEAAQAVIGAKGTNPRKGHSHTWEDVHAEVADVVITGMVALARMRPDAAAYLEAQLELKAAKFLPGDAG